MYSQKGSSNKRCLKDMNALYKDGTVPESEQWPDYTRTAHIHLLVFNSKRKHFNKRVENTIISSNIYQFTTTLFSY